MIQLKLTLDQRRQKKDGSYPLVFRITYNKQTRDIPIKQSIKLENWDKKNTQLKLNSDGMRILAQRLRDKEITLMLKIKEIEQKEAYHNVQQIKELLTKKAISHTLHSFWLEEIDRQIKIGKHGNARNYRSTLLGFCKHLDNLKIPFTQIDYKWLSNAESQMLVQGVSINGVNVYLRALRSIYNKAINHDLVDHGSYPFRKFKIKKDKTTPRVLSLDELKAYFSLNLDPNHPLYISWNIGKLIFMLRGINIKDLMLLTDDNRIEDRLIFRRSKTGKIYSIQILPQIESIIREIRNSITLLGLLDEDNLIDLSKLDKICAQRRKVVNAHLKKLGSLINSRESITTYVFRYSYANIAKQLGYSKDLIAEALGHEYGNSVTGIYLEQFDLSLVDEMNQHIITEITSPS